eukprot:GHVU01182782.1.p3 GENE.GHVU01182782.1~~GHVU01182782.1.p3  ORF type:complete len:101 (+),score=14.88 GHVU01182782.1:659-961(+)
MLPPLFRRPSSPSARFDDVDPDRATETGKSEVEERLLGLCGELGVRVIRDAQLVRVEADAAKRLQVCTIKTVSIGYSSESGGGRQSQSGPPTHAWAGWAG